MPEKEEERRESQRALLRNFVYNSNPGGLSVLQVDDLDAAPEGAEFLGSGERGAWVKDKKILQLVQARLAPALQTRTAGPTESPSPADYAELTQNLALAVPDSTADIAVELGRKMGVPISPENAAAVKEASRAAYAQGLMMFIPGMGPASVGGKVAWPILKELMFAGAVGGGISRGMSAISDDPQMGLQRPEEATADIMANIGGGAGQAVGAGSQPLVREGALKSWAMLDRLTPTKYKPMMRMIANTGRWPRAWGAASGNLIGSISGYAASGQEASAPIVLGLMIPGIYNVRQAAKAGRIAQDLGFVEGFDEIVKKQSVAGAAYRVTQAIEDLGPARREAIANDLILAGIINNTSDLTGDMANLASIYAFRGNKKLQMNFSRGVDPLEAVESASRRAEAQLRLLFPGQFTQNDVTDLIKSFRALTGAENKLIPVASLPNRKQWDIPGAATYVQTGGPGPYRPPLTPDLEPPTPSSFVMAGRREPGPIVPTKPKGKKAVTVMLEEQKKMRANPLSKDVLSLAKIDDLNRHSAQAIALTDFNNLMATVTRDPSGKNLSALTKVVDTFNQAIARGGPDTARLQRTVDKLRNVFILEGVFGQGFKKARVGGTTGELGEFTFDGKAITDYLQKNKGALKGMFKEGEYEGLTDIAKLMAFHQDVALNVGTLERTRTQIMSFVEHRLVFMIGMGAVASSAGVSNPLAAVVLGAGGLAVAGRAIMIAGSKMAEMAMKSPKEAKQLLKASLDGDTIRQGRYLRALLRQSNPEVLEELGPIIDEEQEQPGASSGFFSQFGL